MRLGKVVKSNSHCDYVVQVDDAMDSLYAPTADDYGFGTFVKLEDEGRNDRANKRHWAVGIVYNSQLLNPLFLNTGPRLTSEPDPLFTPDQVQEVRTLLGTVLVGQLETTSEEQYGIQGIPRVVVPVHTSVTKMTLEEIHRFHRNPLGRSQFCYYSHLLRCGGAFSVQLTHQVLEELIQSQLFQGAEERALIVLCRELAWKNTMGAML